MAMSGQSSADHLLASLARPTSASRPPASWRVVAVVAVRTSAESIWISWKTGRNVIWNLSNYSIYNLNKTRLTSKTLLARDWRLWPGCRKTEGPEGPEGQVLGKVWQNKADHWPMSLEASWGWCHYSPACLKAVATFLRCLLRKLQILGELCSQFPAIGDSQTWRLQTHQNDAQAVTRTVWATSFSRPLLSKLLLDAVAASKSNGIQNERHLNQGRQWTTSRSDFLLITLISSFFHLICVSSIDLVSIHSCY